MPETARNQPEVYINNNSRFFRSRLFYLLAALVILTIGAGLAYQAFRIKNTLPAPAVNSSPQPITSSADSDQSGALPPAAALITSALQIESTGSGRIKGTLIIENISEESLQQLYYSLYLRTPESVIPVEREGKVVASTIPGKLIAFRQSMNFILGSKEKKSLPIELPYSSNINPGNHTLQVAIVTKNGQSLGGTFQKLSLSGREIFLEPVANSCMVTIAGKEYPPNIGAAADPGQAPLANCKFTNPTSKTIKARYAMDYAIRYVMSYPASEKNYLAGNDTISFAPRETKTVSISLPSLSTPQVYEAYGRFVDEQNEPVSATFVFRWIVKGPSAHIQTVTLDKDLYRAGETAVVSALISPSMDLYWRTATASGTAGNGTDLTGAKLTASLSDGEGNLCGTAEKDLPAADSFNSWDAENIPVKIGRACQNPQVEIKILEAGQTLAQLSQQTQTNPASLSEATDMQTGISSIQLLIILLGVVSSVILILFILKRNNKGSPPIVPVIIILSLAGLVLGSYSLVLAQCTDPATCTIFTVTPPAANTSPQNVLWVRTGANQSGSNEQAVFGDWWLSGSYIRQISSDSIEVHFEGYTWNQNCGNFLTGFLLSNLVNGDSAGLSISGVAANQVEISQNAPLSDEQPSNGPVSRTYVVTKAGGLPSSYTFTINVEFFQILTSPFWSTPYTYYYSSNRGYDEGRDASIPDGSFSWENGELSQAGNVVDNRRRCGGGAKTGCMGRVQISGNMTASCSSPGNQVALAWSMPGATSYNLRVNSSVNGWNSNCSSPNAGDICLNGASSPYSFISAGGSSYNWWVDACTPQGCPSINGPDFGCSSPPAISSLQINNVAPAAGYTSALKASGRQNTQAEGGQGWYNPMTITLNATQGSNPIKSYYVAFYDKTEGTGSIQTAYSFIIGSDGKPSPNLQSLLQPSYNNGFVLRYDTSGTGTHYVWDQSISDWINITDPLTGYYICGFTSGSKDCINKFYYQVKPVNSTSAWWIAFGKEFGSKNMYTAAYVLDINNPGLPAFKADCVETNSLGDCKLLTP